VKTALKSKEKIIWETPIKGYGAVVEIEEDEDFTIVRVYAYSKEPYITQIDEYVLDKVDGVIGVINGKSTTSTMRRFYLVDKITIKDNTLFVYIDTTNAPLSLTKIEKRRVVV
jgi:hypothetical protein